jgi:hypothetical protein
MKLIKSLMILPAVAALVFSLNASADEMHHGDSHAISQMAEIMMHLHHYPDAHGKKVLLNVHHHVNPKDRGPLNKIMNDPNASEHEKELADIILNLNHKATSADKEKLHDMM